MCEDFSVTTVDGVSVVRRAQVSIERMLEIVKAVAEEGVSTRRMWAVGSLFDVTTNEVLRLAELGRRLWTEPARVAYVAEEEVYYGILRMYEGYRSQDGYETRAILDEKVALGWLCG